jgi:hypothetical protein
MDELMRCEKHPSTLPKPVGLFMPSFSFRDDYRDCVLQQRAQRASTCASALISSLKESSSGGLLKLAPLPMILWYKVK